MIFDQLENFEKYLPLHSDFNIALNWLKGECNLLELQDGRHEICLGKKIYANVQKNVALKALTDANPEFHRQYIDIQVVLAGVERMGWSPLPAKIDDLTSFDKSRDVGFLKLAPVSWCVVPAGYFTVFFPWDLHSPCCGEGVVDKLVIKIPFEPVNL